MATSITALPTPPSRSDPANFAARGDAFLGALPTFAAEANTLAAEAEADAAAADSSADAAAASALAADGSADAAAASVVAASGFASAADASADAAALSAANAVNAPGTIATSTTSHNISTGSKTYTVQTGKLFVPGQRVTIAETASPGNVNYARVETYNSGTGALEVVVDQIDGTGTGITAWTISLSGAIGPEAAGGGAGGETATSPAAYATVTLTSTSTVYQTITPQGWGCSVTLPNATTMPELGKAFVVNNASLQYPLAVYNTAGTLVAAVNPGEAVEVVLLDLGSSAGQWAGLNSASVAAVDSKSFVQVVNRNSMGVVRVSSTLFLLCEVDSVTDIAYARAISISSGQITVGTNTSLSASTWGGNNPFFSAVLADGRVMLSGPNRAVALSISGVTLTVGASVATSASFGTISALLPYSQGVFQIGTKSSATIGFVCRILSIGASGVTITGGTVQTSATAAGPQLFDWQVDSDTLVTAIGTFDAGTAYELRGWKAVRSGTSVTLTASGNAPSARAADENLAATAIKLGSSRFLASYRDTSGNRRHAVLDANTPAWGTSATNAHTTSASYTSSLTAITGGYAVAYHDDVTTGRVEAMTVSGSTITLGAAASFTLNSPLGTSLTVAGTSGAVGFANSGDAFNVKFAGTVTTAGASGGLGLGQFTAGASIYTSGGLKFSVDALGLIVREAYTRLDFDDSASYGESGGVVAFSSSLAACIPGRKQGTVLTGFLSLNAAETTSFLGVSSFGEVALIRSVA